MRGELNVILIELFWSFLKIGFTSFGGLSMIPLINSEVLSHGWMTTAEVADIVAIAEMTPGPLGINCATFAGMRTVGILGAVSANLGVLTPTLSLGVLVAAFFERVKNSRRMKHVMNGVRPASIGMVFGMTMVMCFTNYTNNGKLSLASAAIGLVDLFLLRNFKASVPKVILLNALLGLLCFGALGMT